MFQGTFSHWTDGKPVTLTSWYDHLNNRTYAIETEILISVNDKKNTEVIKNNLRYYEQAETQPSIYPRKNCTIGVVSHKHIRWLVIPCDQSFIASIVCQKEVAIEFMPHSFSFNLLNRTCNDGWLLIESTQKCFKFLAAENRLSFKQANDICWQQNSSILSAGVEYNAHSPIDVKNIMNKINFEYISAKKNTYKYIYPPDLLMVNNVYFGGLLNKYLPENILLRILPLALATSHSIQIFTRIGVHCGIVQYSLFFEVGLHQPHIADKYMKGFGGKYRDCDTLIDVDALVCEKHSKTVSLQTCKTTFFECEDKTCILSIYRCDYVDDCFDRSDEKECNIEPLFSDYIGLNIAINIPCQLNKNCFADTSVLYVHNICDGVHSLDVLINETDYCRTIIPTHIDLSSMTTTTANFIDKLIDVPEFSTWQYYDRERFLFVKDSMLSFSTPRDVNKHKYEPLTVLCSSSGEGVHMHQRCMVGVHSKPCNYGFTKDICEHILCPGMYKCRDYYCIPVAAVCDGQNDCLYGDDETFCDRYHCPGFLKCRGENRCVSFDDVCDESLDCRYSPDDEVNCPPCPEGCVCEGYMMTCEEMNTWREGSRVSYAKGLVITGVHTSFIIHNHQLQHLVYISMYACSLRNITLNSNLYNEKLLFANFSKNKLTYFDKFAHPFFSTILTLDLNVNLITYITDADHEMEYLVVLYISNNPIKSIKMHNTMPKVKFIEMKNVYYDGYISLYLSPRCNIIVSDFTICCILSSNIKCTSVNGIGNCWGLFQNVYMKYCFYVIIMITLLISMTTVFKIIYDKPWKKSKKKHYMITKFNYLTADIFSVVYYLVLFATDVMALNYVSWRKSVLCLLLKTVVSISLQISLIFKTLSFSIVALKIRYPFRHQLTWFNYLVVIFPIIWLLIAFMEIYHFSTDKFVNGRTYIDTFCTCFDCLKYFQTFTFIPAFINIVCLFAFITVELTTYLHLTKKRDIQKNITSTNIIPVKKVVLKMGRSFTTEFILRLLILFVYTCKYFNLHFSEKLCVMVVLYVVPLNIIISDILTLIDR